MKATLTKAFTAALLLALASCASQPPAQQPAKYQSRADFSREWCARNGVKYVANPADEEHPTIDGFVRVAGFPGLAAFRIMEAAAPLMAGTAPPTFAGASSSGHCKE